MDAALNVKFGADTTALINEVKKVDITLAGLQNRLRSLQNQRLTVVDPAQLASINRQIDGITGQIAKFKSVGTEAFEAVSKKVDGVAESSKGLVTGVNEGYSAIRKLAFILPGIGIAGIFNVAFEGLSAIISEVTKSLSEGESAIKAYNNTLGESGKQIGEVNEDVHRMAALFEDARDGVVSKTTVLNEYNKKFGDSLGIAKDYNEAEALFSSKTDAYLSAMKQRAIADAAYGLAKKEIASQIESDAKNETTFLSRIGKIFAAVGGNTTALQALNVGLKANSIATSNTLIENYNRIGDSAERLAQKIAQGADININGKGNQGLKTLPDTLAKTGAALKEIISLEDELAKPNELPLFQRLANSLDPSRAQLLENKIAQVLRDNVANGISKAITGKEVGLLQEQLRRLLSPNITTKIDTRVEVNPIVADDVKAFESTIAPQLAALLDKLPALKTDIKVDPTMVVEKTAFAKKLDGLKAVIAETLVGLGEGIAEDIGKALAGVKDPFGDLLTLLGDGLITIGKQMIIVGGLAELIQAALGTLFVSPGTAIVVGALAIAIGSALKSINSQKGVKAFAEGGIVTGPTNALIGEAGPEVVFPLDKLNKFIRGNTGTSRMEIVGNTVISGPNLITVFKRAQNNQGMV